MKLVSAGELSILVADEDIMSVQTVSVQKGPFAVPVSIDASSEPGVHLLASLVRPIETGSEHLPQISLGKVWVPTIGENRELGLSISVSERMDSATPVSVTLKTNAETGSAIVFVVDEGIHALTKYENKNLNDHYLSERALNYGIMTNFGELISQDLALSTFRVGGDGDMLSSSAAVDKSEFLKLSLTPVPYSQSKTAWRISHSQRHSNGRVNFVLLRLPSINQGLGLLKQM